MLPEEASTAESAVGHCGGLYVLGPGSGTTRRCGLVGVGVASLEEGCHCRDGLLRPSS